MTKPICPLIAIVDDEPDVRESIAQLLRSVCLESHTYGSAEEFEEAIKTHEFGCLILDIRMPVMSGLGLYEKLKAGGFATPTVFITGYADVPMAVRAIKMGGLDLIEKPFSEQTLIDRVNDCFAVWSRYSSHKAAAQKIMAVVETLTRRERMVMDLVVSGMPNKAIAEQLGISRKTLDIHRSKLMQKTGARTLADLTASIIRSESFKS